MIKSNYKIVRRILKILHNDVYLLSEKVINKRIEKVKNEAIESARVIKIQDKNMDISIDYYPDFQPMEHPVGPIKAPESWRECLAMYWARPCVVSIVIRDKSEN